jgi:hypothetical protein
MKLTIAALAVLAMVGSAMAWDINEELQYTYTKNAYQQAGADLVAPQIVGAKSGAYFSEPSAYGTAQAKVTNELDKLTIDRKIMEDFEYRCISNL